MDSTNCELKIVRKNCIVLNMYRLLKNGPIYGDALLKHQGGMCVYVWGTKSVHLMAYWNTKTETKAKSFKFYWLLLIAAIKELG
jgi:hypothetical protein